MSATPTHTRSRPQRNAPRARQIYPITEFNGIDNSNDPSSINVGQSPDTLNTILDSIGAIENRPGYTKLLTTKLAHASSNGYPYYKSDGTKQLVYGSVDGLFRYDNVGGSVQLTGVSLTPVSSWFFDEYQDVVYGVDGTEAVSYNGSTVALVAPAGVFSAPTLIRTHKNRIWIAQGSTLYFSDAGNPTSFPVVSFINVNTNDGQQITGLEILLDSLIVFKTNSIWVITGEPLGAGSSTVIGNLSLRRANSAVGCIAPKTIQKVDSYIMFMAADGLYRFENYQVKLVSQPVVNTFRNDMNGNVQNLNWGLFSPYQKKYLVGFTSAASNTPDKVLVYDMIVDHLTIWDHVSAGWAVNFRFSQADVALIGDPLVGNIYQLFQGQADIAGANGTITDSSSTTLVDSSMTWTTNQFVDARIQVGLGTGTQSTAVVVSNTATTLTVASWAGGTPSIGQVYSVGGYQSYWKSKIFDFDEPGMVKRFKYFKIFTDSEGPYSLQWGVSIDFAPLTFNQPPISLNSGQTFWDQGGVFWDQAGIVWDSKLSIFRRPSIPGSGRWVQVIFGNFNSNQPWRVFEYAFEYKSKKERPS